jgi:hypothetical protein
VAALELSESWSERISRIGIGAGDISRAIAWTWMSCRRAGTTKSFREEGVRLALCYCRVSWDQFSTWLYRRMSAHLDNPPRVSSAELQGLKTARRSQRREVFVNS